MKKNRKPEIHFYEWSVPRWFTSNTRQVLKGVGRGIYRELLDLCYAQGAIPRDPDLQASFCAVTRAEMDEVWPLISHHFQVHPKNQNLLTNRFADVYRRSYFRFINKQRTNRLGKGAHKPNEPTEINAGGHTQNGTDTIRHDTIREDTIRNDTTEDEKKRLEDERVSHKFTHAFYEIPLVYQELFFQLVKTHPKGTKLFRASEVFTEKVKSGRINAGTIPLIAAEHPEQCKSFDWNKENCRYCPTLAQYFEGEGWIDERKQVAGLHYDQPRRKTNTERMIEELDA